MAHELRILRFKLYCARLDTILDRIPHPKDIDSEDEGLDNKTKVWLDAHKVVDALGIEGQSSDESERDGTATVYYAKQLEWRSTNVGCWLRKVDDYRSRLATGGAR
ncbi:hypothetical protein CPB83DRAFT_895495 [Crepidotus variabilis]|uniref:Uncharacterized protein n=1 Tax=Crepidotus variabilis TaxID=179855 RepID=A0A9P6JNQ9_9AGAR|nr:hypothetical protein CPB83DRAFT_895495 [Crepidotus variabilis]